MSLPSSHIHLLRTAFQTCRPRTSIQRQLDCKFYYLNKPTRLYSNPAERSTTAAVSSSVSQEEVSHFSRLASTWWDPYGPSRLLHLMNPLRHDFISTCLQSDPSCISTSKRTYLDIGCGGGIFASSAARRPHTETVTAIDPTSEVIAVAKEQQRSDPILAEPKLTYLNCAIEDLSAQLSSDSDGPQLKSTMPDKEQFDVITLFEVIEHIGQPSDFLQTALKHLKPGGWLIGSTISRHPISYLTTKLIAEAPLIGVVPAGTHDWNKYIKPGELRDWFSKQQLMQTTERHKEAQDAYANVSNAFGPVRIAGVIYVPFIGWKLVKGSEEVGNYFFGVQKLG